MTLVEYVTIMKAEIEAFEQKWREEHAKNPQQWPLELFVPIGTNSSSLSVHSSSLWIVIVSLEARHHEQASQ
jgi:hypothetical protein